MCTIIHAYCVLSTHRTQVYTIWGQYVSVQILSYWPTMRSTSMVGGLHIYRWGGYPYRNGTILTFVYVYLPYSYSSTTRTVRAYECTRVSVSCTTVLVLVLSSGKSTQTKNQASKQKQKQKQKNLCPLRVRVVWAARDEQKNFIKFKNFCNENVPRSFGGPRQAPPAPRLVSRAPRFSPPRALHHS